MPAEIITWYEPDGTPHLLSDYPYFGMLRGRKGAFMPPVRHVQDRVPMQNGARFRDSFYDPRVLDMPFHMEDTDEETLRDHLRNLMGWFNVSDGDGQLEVAFNGTTRRLNCRFLDGLGLDESMENNGIYWQDFILTLLAADPFWYNAAATEVEFSGGAGGGLFFPILPMTLITGAIFGTNTVNNPGDVEAWPIWTIEGPTSGGIELQNVTTGRTLILSSLVLTTGQTLTIDTRPLYKTIKREDGSNQMGNGFSGSLWPMAKGDNEITTSVAGFTVDTRVTLSFYPGYLAP